MSSAGLVINRVRTIAQKSLRSAEEFFAMVAAAEANSVMCYFWHTPENKDWHTHMGVSIITLPHSLYHKSLMTHAL